MCIRDSTLIADRYAGSLFRKDGFHQYTDANGKFLARLLRVEPDGRLILEDQIGTERTYLFKEEMCIRDRTRAALLSPALTVLHRISLLRQMLASYDNPLQV